MKNTQNKNNVQTDWKVSYYRMRNLAKYFLIAMIVLGLACGYNSFMMLRYHLLYNEAIQQGAENIVLAVEMTTACISLGNFTQDEIKDKWIDMFLKNEKHTK